MSTPFFSIIIPTRNRFETLPYAIQTVLEQSFDSYELIISDNSDASNVYTEKLVKEYPAEKKNKVLSSSYGFTNE